MMKSSCLLLLAVALVGAMPQKEPLRDYNGAQVLRVSVDNLSALRYMVWMQSHTVLDFWTQPRSLGPTDILATRWDLPWLKKTLERLGLEYEVHISDVAQHLAEGRRKLEEARSKSTRMDWVTYHPFDEIMDWLDQLAVDYPDIATVTDVGTSYEGRTMKLLKLSTGGDKDAIFSTGGMHAREWIGPATVTYFINELVTNDVNGFLDAVDFYFMPVINPDGYSYSWTDDRLWRKTRSPNEGSVCIGTDPNRNWDSHWMEVGASDLPCAQTYAGSEAFSEIEMRVVRDQLLALVPRVYFDFHSYSQLWMYPWGWTSELPDNWEDLDSLGQAGAAALTAVYGTSYQVGSVYNIIYPSAGGSDDYAMESVGCEYVYCVELRDRGEYGFELPESQITETAIETYEGFKVVAQFIADNPTMKKTKLME